MAQRYIYLSDELNIKLKEEKNVSGLIQNLLNDYYKTHKIESIEDLEQREADIKAKRDQLNKQLEKEQMEVITKKELAVKQTEFIEEKIVLSKEKLEEKRESVKQYFKLYTQREITEEELNEYMHRLEEHSITGLGEYITELNERALAPI